MPFTPAILPQMIEAVVATIEQNAEEVTTLDQAIGDGDHVTNLQRGIQAVQDKSAELSQSDWAVAWQKIGMTLLSTMGGASGSLFGTFFISMSKAVSPDQPLNLQGFAAVFAKGVEAVKKRGKAQAGEKTMLDVLIPVADSLQQAAAAPSAAPDLFDNLCGVAVAGMESTKDMVATKGRASFMEERTLGHIDAGAKSSQLIICAILDVLKEADKA
jgi:dihydroxyacetone kinase-like protein